MIWVAFHSVFRNPKPAWDDCVFLLHTGRGVPLNLMWSVISWLLICFISKKPLWQSLSSLMLKYICSTFLSKLLPIQFLFCPQKLISSVWLIAIIFSSSLTICNVHLFFIILYNSAALFALAKPSGCAESKAGSAWKDSDFSRLWIVCECHSFCASLCQLKGLFASGCSFLSLISVWCFLKLYDNEEVPFWGFQFD